MVGLSAKFHLVSKQTKKTLWWWRQRNGRWAHLNETESLIKLHFVILNFFYLKKRKLRLLLIKVLKADIIVIHTFRVRNCSSGLALTLPTAPKSAYAFKIVRVKSILTWQLPFRTSNTLLIYFLEINRRFNPNKILSWPPAVKAKYIDRHN